MHTYIKNLFAALLCLGGSIYWTDAGRTPPSACSMCSFILVHLANSAPVCGAPLPSRAASAGRTTPSGRSPFFLCVRSCARCCGCTAGGSASGCAAVPVAAQSVCARRTRRWLPSFLPPPAFAGDSQAASVAGDPPCCVAAPPAPPPRAVCMYTYVCLYVYC
jgi:hypothetical protein